ncbi:MULTISPECIES: helix-turn-helix domain-containing protein [Mammaliicoccus]|uniref:helix-turn-helix domain-containing protein n=1 Tax=Mammaliicoccus TaxID=2803850 RepID=UPI00177B4BD5|nr:MULTISPECIES: helix-turn-helix domain-containing protein [Mammaliicoccus]MBF9297238.1 helix-turn-helix domain-containing protein [Staphylococcus schleiferi]MCJ1783134.1 helix-turn-helix domain-containing protein [Mammaliicoccus sciuri]
MSNLKILPNEKNVIVDSEQVVFNPIYAKPGPVGKAFGVSRTTVYNWLKSYEQDNLGIEGLYLDLTPGLTLINIQKLEEFLKKKHKKWL